MPKQVRIAPPDLAALAAADWTITRACATALVADRMRDRDVVPERMRKDRARKAIAARIVAGELKEARPGKFRVGDIAELGRSVWPGWNDSGLPPIFRLNAEVGLFRWQGGDTLSARTVVLPTTIDECHQRIREKDAEIIRLAEVECELRQRIAKLEPDAQRYRDLCETNRLSAQGKRKR